MVMMCYWQLVLAQSVLGLCRSRFCNEGLTAAGLQDKLQVTSHQNWEIVRTSFHHRTNPDLSCDVLQCFLDVLCHISNPLCDASCRQTDTQEQFPSQTLLLVEVSAVRPVAWSSLPAFSGLSSCCCDFRFPVVVSVLPLRLLISCGVFWFVIVFSLMFDYHFLAVFYCVHLAFPICTSWEP